MKKILFVFIISCTSFCSVAQKKYITRQSDWQQKVNYIINVKLDDVINVLRANEIISYTNNSPSEINFIYFHLWANGYRNTETEFAKQNLENGSTEFYFSPDEDKGRIDSLNFKVNGEKVNWHLLDTIDICKIELNEPLKHGQTIQISTPFRVKIPKVFSRMGHEGQLYCITQWYPKPAVFDVNGWNYFPYLDEGEFYSEFGKFDVSITVPKNYVVAATGNLQNEDEKIWLKSMTNIKFPLSSLPPSEKNKHMRTFESSKEFKTLRFIQDSVHDFAWFCDKRFWVEESSVILKSGKKVNTFLYHVDPSQNAVKWIDSAVLFYSRLVGEYPYSVASAVVTPLKAGAGMEYPTITNVDAAGEGVIVHEVGHNWFYGILANNERIFPWMDESFNNYYETRFEYKKKNPAIHSGIKFNIKHLNINIDETPFGFLQQSYLFTARKNIDQPVNIPAPEFEDMNYGTIIYGKAPLMFHMLQDYLGDSLFDAMMQAYYQKWKFKHPLPDDFFDHAKSFTGKNLDWFNQIYSTTIKQDYKFVSLKKNEITIKNKSSVASPFTVSSMIKDSVISTKWFEGFTGKKTFMFDKPVGDKLRIDAYETTLDVYRSNNTIRTAGIFKTVNPIQFKFLGDIENPYKTQIFYSPIIGANLYNKTMLGMAFYDGLIPQRKFDFVITPMYSFGTNDVVGYANFEKHFLTTGIFNQIHLGVNAARFAYEYFINPVTYNKVAPFIRFDLDKKNKRSSINQSIQLRSVFLFYNANINSDAAYSIPSNSRIDELSYSINNKKVINKNSFTATIQNINENGNAVKLFAEFKQSINYDKPKKKLDVRFFAGTFLMFDKSIPSGDAGFYEFKSSGNNGQYDYLFDHALMGRSAYNGLFAYQLLEKDGNLLMPVSIASTNSWVASANFVTTIPGPIPIRLFADFGYINASSFSSQTGTTSYTPTFQYVAGIKLVVFEDIFEINFPLFNSNDFENYYLLNYQNYQYENSFQHIVRKITFTLNLNKLNPIKIVRDVTL